MSSSIIKKTSLAGTLKVKKSSISQNVYDAELYKNCIIWWHVLLRKELPNKQNRLELQ